MSNKIGIIAEDNSDVDVLNVILQKYISKSSYSIRKFVGKGSSKIRKKCKSWANTLKSLGCNHLIVAHDLDANDKNCLKRLLESQVKNSGFANSIIIIPVLEIEAWLLADTQAIKKTFNLKAKPKDISNTENIHDPKQFIRDIVWRIGRKEYLHTAHNSKIAENARLLALRRCTSYIPLDKYIISNLKKP